MSDYMQEAERLVSELIDAAHGTVMNEDQSREDETRAALLAHIERGRVLDGWKPVPVEPTDEMLAVWLTPEQRDGGKSGGNMQPWSRALRLYDAMLAAAPAPDNFRDATKMMAAPAGVPMPKPVAYGFGNTAITGHTNRLMMVLIDIPGDDQYAGYFWLPLVLADEAHTYGVACRAAGEAAGYVRGLRDAVRDAEIEALRLYVRALCKAVDAATDFIGTVAGGASWWDDVWADHAAALDRARERISQAALRGEVKP